MTADLSESVMLDHVKWTWNYNLTSIYMFRLIFWLYEVNFNMPNSPFL